MEGFPQVAWSIDSFRAWLAQSASKTAISGIGSIGGIAAGVMSGNPVIAGAGVLGLASSINEAVLASNRPPQAKGVDAGTVDVATRTKNFFFKRMQVDLDHAIVIDDFFSVYGYAIGEVKFPNFNARPHWTYIKTRKCSVESNAPADDVKKICSIIDNGITFWRNAGELGNYSLDNSPA